MTKLHTLGEPPAQTSAVHDSSGGMRLRMRVPEDTASYGNGEARYQAGWEQFIHLTSDVDDLTVQIDFKVDNIDQALNNHLEV